MGFQTPRVSSHAFDDDDDDDDDDDGPRRCQKCPM